MLTHHRQQPAEEGRPGALRAEVGVQRVPTEQRLRTGAGEPLVQEPAQRLHREPGEPQPLRHAERASQPDAATDRRERGEQRVQQGRAEPPPARALGVPGGGVGRIELGQRLGGAVHVPMQHRAPVVGKHVCQHGWRVPPAQAVPLQFQPAQHRRRGAQRIERAAQVALKTRRRDLRGPHGPARFRLGLQHEGLPAGVGQQVRGDQAVVTGADHDGVDGGHGTASTQGADPETPPRPVSPSSPGRAPCPSRRTCPPSRTTWRRRTCRTR